MPPRVPVFDLQSHSLHSDGQLPPAEVVARAAAAGVELVALTDHDTVDGVAEALVAARRHGIALSPAVEMSAVHGAREDLHVLGYEVDFEQPELQALLEDYRGDRARRIEAMVERLRDCGFELDGSALAARRRAGRPLGRPHVADAVLAQPGNRRKLAEEGIVGRDALFEAYLVPGARAYVPRSRPTVAEAIADIHAAGGVAVWAHPFWDVDREDEALVAIDEFVAAGLDGVEVFYAGHSAGQTRWLHAVCGERDLLMTGSADFHGPDHDRFHSFRAFDLHGLAPRLGPIGAGAGRVGA